MKVLVCGGSAVNDEAKVPNSLDYWLQRMEINGIVQSSCRMMGPGERLTHRLAAAWAERRRLKAISEEIPDADLKRGGPGVRLEHLRTLIARHKPEYVIVFPGAEVAEITRQARQLGVRCIEVA